MSRTKDYYATYEDPTYDQDGTCELEISEGISPEDSGSIVFEQMIAQLTQKPELQFD